MQQKVIRRKEPKNTLTLLHETAISRTKKHAIKSKLHKITEHDTIQLLNPRKTPEQEIIETAEGTFVRIARQTATGSGSSNDRVCRRLAGTQPSNNVLRTVSIAPSTHTLYKYCTLKQQ